MFERSCFSFLRKYQSILHQTRCYIKLLNYWLRSNIIIWLFRKIYFCRYNFCNPTRSVIYLWGRVTPSLSESIRPPPRSLTQRVKKLINVYGPEKEFLSNRIRKHMISQINSHLNQIWIRQAGHPENFVNFINS